MTANNCYIITELYNDGDLSKLLKQKGKFTQPEAFEIFTQFYQGYKHFNVKGYIHRDIKPSNILIKSFGQAESEKKLYVMADFGFIKYLEENPKDSFNVGTPVYMAPQSITSNIYTVKSDIWSMGVMLFQLVYGYLPFQSRSEVDLKREICNKDLKLNEVDQKKEVYTSVEFKSLLLSCLRKNPENRICLDEIDMHPWFRKFTTATSPAYDLNIRIQKSPNYYRRSTTSLSSKQNTQQQKLKSINTYGYIGNVAIKRQKSLQANNFSLKNYQKNPSLSRESIDISIERHKQKAQLLGVLSITPQNQKKTSQPSQKTRESDTYFICNYQQKFKNNFSFPITDSPKLNLLLQKKNGLHSKESMLQGMKGIIGLKNNHVLRINNNGDRRMDKEDKKRQCFVKVGQCDKETSRSFEENKVNVSNSFAKGMSRNLLQTSSMINNENISLHANIQPFSSPQLPLKKQISHQKSSSQQFVRKSLHLLRYIFEVLTVLSEYQGDMMERLEEGKEFLENFFVQYFERVRKCILTRENVFELKDWEWFVNGERYGTFVEVIGKYDEKYLASKIIGGKLQAAKLKHQSDTFIASTTQNYNSTNYTLLKLAQQLGTANKENTKKSLKPSISTSYNSTIIIVYNIHKCLQMIQNVQTSKNITSSMEQIDPQKDLTQMTLKSKDPFRISKIEIFMKKRLILVEGGNYMLENEAARKVGRPKRQQSVGRISVR